MRWLGALIDRAILLAAVLLAGCIPSFLVQYRQRAGGRLDQVLADLAPFQQIADHNFGGSVPALIRYHLASRDANFHQEGAALQSLLDAAARLRATVQALNADLLHQCWYVLGHPEPGLLRATWSAYQPAFTFTMQSVLFALGLGVLIWAVLLGAWLALAGLARAVFSSPAPRAAPSAPRPTR